jgi:hypothetical protein
MFRWRDVPRPPKSHIYEPGTSPAEHHPAQWPRLELHRFGELLDESGQARCSVAVHSTRRSRDGWSYNVVESLQRPTWVAYFHHAATGQRLKHAATEDAIAIEAALDIHQLL